ncbi:MAG: PilZ domain-containing protein [Pseudobutyrivibrio sp.]|nr:PilZ domain-containing protein [Pseudobutyrivibrio sp.]
MRLSEITNEHKPYIRVTKDNRRIEIPLKLMPVKLEHPTAYYLGFEPIKFKWQGRIVALDWSFKDTTPALYCTNNKKGYMWDNVKVMTSKENGKKFGLVLTQIDIGVECERRRFKRTTINEPIELIQDGITVQGEAANISYSGIGIRIRHSEVLTNDSTIMINFTNKGTVFPIKIVRTMILDSENQFIGCSVSPKYKHEIAKILSLDEARENTAKAAKRSSQPGADRGWDQKEIKRWH